jgi:hypothetical protein
MSTPLDGFLRDPRDSRIISDRLLADAAGRANRGS